MRWVPFLKMRKYFVKPLEYQLNNYFTSDFLLKFKSTEACSFAFQCLYDNVNKFNDYFQQYWSIVSQTFANHTAILGYEILNEPWAGDIYANPLLLLPGVAGIIKYISYFFLNEYINMYEKVL